MPTKLETRETTATLSIFFCCQELGLQAAVKTDPQIYLLLIADFRSRGGHRAEVPTGHAAEDEKFTGGALAPGEG